MQESKKQEDQSMHSTIPGWLERLENKVSKRALLIASLVLVALVAVLSAGLDWNHMPSGGGVKSQQITGNTFRIVSRGNAYTSNVKIQDYTLLKAAETTRAAGATHFMIVSSEDATRTGYIETASTARTTVSGNTAHTTFDPGAKIQLVKPGQDTYIRVFTIAAGQSPPPGSMSAAEIIQFVGSRVKNG